MSAQDVHVEFVSNRNATSTISETFFVALSAPLSIALTAAVIPLVPRFLLTGSRHYVTLPYSSRIWIHCFIEALTVICPLVFSFTLLSDVASISLIATLLLITIMMATTPKWWYNTVPPVNHLLSIPLLDSKPPFMTNYRAGMNLATAICILAVDFQVFPRRFAKTEMYGYSLMDVGVGSFVMANGLVDSSHQFSNRVTKGKVWSKIRPLLVLGFMRLLAVKMSNYHEHVTEYGIHWNFFFTLATLKAASLLITPPVRPGLFSLLILGVYEAVLKLGLEQWILSESTVRDGLISANREGIFSLLGYLAIHYAALEIGHCIRNPHRSTFEGWFKLLLVLMATTFFGYVGLQVSEITFGKPSRRLANASFCFWMLTYNMGILSCYLLVDLLLVAMDRHRDSEEEKETNLSVFREPYLMRFINFNGLTFFLASNLLTGLINMSFDTIHMTPFGSMTILFVYCNLLGFGSAILYLWRIKLL